MEPPDGIHADCNKGFEGIKIILDAAGVKDSIQKRREELNKSKGGASMKSSRIQKWAETPNDNRIPEVKSDKVSIPGKMKNLAIVKKVPEIMKSLRKSDIILIEAPTGTGKSVLPPFLLHQLAMETCNDPNKFHIIDDQPSWKVVHCGPLGEQCIQHCDYLTSMDSDIKFGVYTASVNDQNLKSSKTCEENTDYIYCTTFFANHVFSGKLHALIIDECHDLTPEMIKTFYFAKKAMSESLSDKKKIFKLILLTATLSSEVRSKLEEYFSIPKKVFEKLKFVEAQYDNDTIFLSDKMNSVVKNVKEYYNDRDLYTKEMTFIGEPDTQVLRERSAAVFMGHYIELEEGLKKTKNMPNLPGIISFLPGEHEVSRSRQMVLAKKEWTKRFVHGTGSVFKSLNQTFDVELFKISGKDRADIKCLKQPYERGDPVRGIQSSPLLASGVTLCGVGSVIDDCTVKVPEVYNHAGIIMLKLIWQDRNMIMQKKGRAGRQGHGKYYPVISKLRYDGLLLDDHTLLRLDRGYRTNDLCFILKHKGKLMIEPDERTLKELLIDMYNTGFLSIPHGLPTSLAEVLSGFLSTIPLALGDLLLRCFSFGVAVHGLVFVASCMEDHRAVRAPAYTGKGSRDDDEMPILMWHTESNANYNSDMELVAEIVFNLLMMYPLHQLKLKEKREHDKKNEDDRMKRIEEGKPPIDYDEYPPPWITPQIPEADRFVNKDAVHSTMRHVMMAMSCLMSAGVCTKVFRQLLKEAVVSDYNYINKHVHSTGVFKIHRLKDEKAKIFRAVLLQSFGSRLCFECDGQEKSRGNRKMFFIETHIESGNVPSILQGELSVKSPSHLAVYYQLSWRARNDDRLIGLLHYVSAVEFIIFGNVAAANLDEFNEKLRILKIATNTIPFYAQFRNVETLRAVGNCRRMLHLVSISVVKKSLTYNHTYMMAELVKMVVMLYNNISFKNFNPFLKMANTNVAFVRYELMDLKMETPIRCHNKPVEDIVEEIIKRPIDSDNHTERSHSQYSVGSNLFDGRGYVDSDDIIPETSDDDRRSVVSQASKAESAVFYSSHSKSQESELSNDDRKAAPRTVASSLSQMTLASDSSVNNNAGSSTRSNHSSTHKKVGASMGSNRMRKEVAAHSISEGSELLSDRTQDSSSVIYEEMLRDEPPRRPFEIDGFHFTGDATLDGNELSRAVLSANGLKVITKYRDIIQGKSGEDEDNKDQKNDTEDEKMNEDKKEEEIVMNAEDVEKKEEDVEKKDEDVEKKDEDVERKDEDVEKKDEDAKKKKEENGDSKKSSKKTPNKKTPKKRTPKK